MSCVIYKIESPTGRVYIGQTVDWCNRLVKYKSMGCKGQPRLYASFLKHGFDAHIFSIIESVEEGNLNNREAYWQVFYDVLSNGGLNCKIQNSNDKSGRLSEETKEKISRSHKGKKFSQETLRKMSEAKLGRKIPESQRLKMMGRKQSKEQIEALRQRMMGNSYTKGFVPPNARKVIDDSTGLIYESASRAADAKGIKRTTLVEKLRGARKNNTTMRYL